MIIQHQVNGSNGKFFIIKDEKQIAIMQYNLKDKVMEIYHTKVDENFQDQQIGSGLVEEGVKYARGKNLTIVPICEFVKAFISKREDLQDVL